MWLQRRLIFHIVVTIRVVTFDLLFVKLAIIRLGRWGVVQLLDRGILIGGCTILSRSGPMREWICCRALIIACDQNFIIWVRLVVAENSFIGFDLVPLSNIFIFIILFSLFLIWRFFLSFILLLLLSLSLHRLLLIHFGDSCWCIIRCRSIGWSSRLLH